jgi:hypothetical protein
MIPESKEKRNKFLIIRLTESEMGLVQEFKKKEGANVSLIVRKTLLDIAGAYLKRDVVSEIPKLIAQYPATPDEALRA